jgi:thioredoxin reductase
MTYARSFHCLFCFGYEQRGSASSGILAADMNLQIPLYLHVARNALQLSNAVTIYTNGDTSRTAAFRECVGGKAMITVDERRITGFILGEDGVGVTVTFEDGSTKEEAFLAHNPEVKLRSAELVEQLGLEVNQGSVVVQPPFGETSVPGCFAAGDAMTTVRMIPTAFSTGATAASGVAGHVQSRTQDQQSLGEFLRASQKKH